MKGFLSLLLILSIALNIGFLTGCATFHDAVYGNPCKYSSHNPPMSGNDGKAQLTRIATLLGIPTSGKSASDLASDILYELDRQTPVPEALDPVSYDKLSERLLTAEKPVLLEYQRFISDLQGKQVIVIEPER